MVKLKKQTNKKTKIKKQKTKTKQKTKNLFDKKKNIYILQSVDAFSEDVSIQLKQKLFDAKLLQSISVNKQTNKTKQKQKNTVVLHVIKSYMQTWQC